MRKYEHHESLYKGAHRGDTWTLSENLNENPRMRAVQMVRSQFDGPISVLDIGCGKALNSKWIADHGDGSTWTGVDVLAKEKIGLEIEENQTHKFFEGNIDDPEFRKSNGLDGEKFDLIVDQGAVFVASDDSEIEQYLKLAHSLLKEKGVFLVLTLLEKSQVMIFPDGRKRVFRSIEDFQREPFSKYFEIEDVVKKNPFTYAGYSYVPDELAPNPIHAKVGDDFQIHAAQIPLHKKIISEAN